MILGFTFSLLAFALAPAERVVHEWGTFTMVIDSDGKQLDWYRPLLTEPLPAFVYSDGIGKVVLDYPVRMETPVLYFHTDQPYVASVSVDWGEGIEGRLTEWYPTADGTQGLSWPRVEIDPTENGPFPLELGGDHYYAARATDAAGVRVSTERGVERERFLFYRGLAQFSLPLRVTPSGSDFHVTNPSEDSYSHAFLFERRGEKAILLELGTLRPGAAIAIDRTQLAIGSRVSIEPLERALVADGLYRDEARAMIETWRKSWFGEGTRVLFTLPRPKIDALLPLSITPTPTRIDRVFVGRYEIVTPELHEEILAFARQCERGPVDAADLAAARQRFERVGYAVMLRSARDLAEQRQQAASERRFAAAWQFADFSIEAGRTTLGQTETR